MLYLYVAVLYRLSCLCVYVSCWDHAFSSTPLQWIVYSNCSVFYVDPVDLLCMLRQNLEFHPKKIEILIVFYQNALGRLSLF